MAGGCLEDCPQLFKSALLHHSLFLPGFLAKLKKKVVVSLEFYFLFVWLEDSIEESILSDRPLYPLLVSISY